VVDGRQPDIGWPIAADDLRSHSEHDGVRRGTESRDDALDHRGVIG
jgi:hypothetical protein